MALGSLQGIKKCTINIKISKNITIVFKMVKCLVYGGRVLYKVKRIVNDINTQIGKF